MTHSPQADVLTVTGGDTRSAGPCSSRTPHGYRDMAPAMAARIGGWIDARMDARAARE